MKNILYDSVLIAMIFFYFTSGTDQNTCLLHGSELNTYLRVSSSSCQIHFRFN
jgi:hypothetical protein